MNEDIKEFLGGGAGGIYDHFARNMSALDEKMFTMYGGSSAGSTTIEQTGASLLRGGDEDKKFIQYQKDRLEGLDPSEITDADRSIQTMLQHESGSFDDRMAIYREMVRNGSIDSSELDKIEAEISETVIKLNNIVQLSKEGFVRFQEELGEFQKESSLSVRRGNSAPLGSVRSAIKSSEDEIAKLELAAVSSTATEEMKSQYFEMIDIEEERVSLLRKTHSELVAMLGDIESRKKIAATRTSLRANAMGTSFGDTSALDAVSASIKKMNEEIRVLDETIADGSRTLEERSEAEKRRDNLSAEKRAAIGSEKVMKANLGDFEPETAEGKQISSLVSGLFKEGVMNGMSSESISHQIRDSLISMLESSSGNVANTRGQSKSSYISGMKREAGSAAAALEAGGP